MSLQGNEQMDVKIRLGQYRGITVHQGVNAVINTEAPHTEMLY